MAGTQLLKRVPRIKFPQRHPKPAGSASETQSASAGAAEKNFSLSSEVPAPPRNTTVGGKASLQPKRTPVSEREIEAILMGGCF
ncbi:hypothetical protein H6P81_014412 [Aristolochia fimbriata]|uniref:Uncharacterized protein n=1 Tax=Aristolochia fimbriata TaxID=158543 RepID=A0AAV7EIY5_ARIFI|nr:hypothetical protein H6P81_014412 [Aristolochia fimbriata]